MSGRALQPPRLQPESASAARAGCGTGPLSGRDAGLVGERGYDRRLNRVLITRPKHSHDILAAQLNEDGVMHQAPDNGHDRTLVRLAWLAPDLQAAILDGRQKPGLCLEDLRCMAIPLCWDDQRAQLGD